MSESTWLTKKIYRDALRKGKVYISGQNSGRNGITMYKLFINRRIRSTSGKYETRMWEVCGHTSYWSNRYDCYHVTCWGTSRPLEIILGVGHGLGLKFHEMQQRWNYL